MDKEKILIIQTAFLGDAVLTLPMIQKLKEKYVGSVIDVVCIPTTADVFKHSPYVSNVIIYDKKNSQKSIFALIGFGKMLRAKNYSKIFSPHRSFRTSLIVYLANVKSTYGFDNSSLKFVYKNLIHYKKDIHEVARNLELTGLEVSDDNWKILPEITIPKETENKVKSVIPKKDRKFAAIAPGSVWTTKIYPREYYSEIARYLINGGYSVFFIGGKGDVELCESLSSIQPGYSSSLAGKLDVIESIGLLKKCSLLISNDSAPTHLGMAANIPVLAIYCSTIPDFGFFPYNDKSDFISFDNLTCKPCGIHGRMKCPIKTYDCGYKLVPELVISKLKQIETF